jgi:hypothetical protein
MTSLFDRYLQESDAFAAKNKTPELTRATRCLKVTLIGANILFLIFSIVLMAVGTVASNQSVGPLSGTEIPTGIVVLGVFILILSLIGCLGAWKESRIFLGCYFFFLLLLTILLFAVGLAVYSKREQAGAYMLDGWTLAPNNVRVTFQKQLKCCGLLTFNDSLAGIPCPDEVLVNATDGSQVACLPLMTNLFRDSMQQLGGVAVAFAVLMFLGMVFVCVLMRGIRQKSAKDAENPVDDTTTGPSGFNDASV